jgi:hypothetical protein
MKPPPCQQNCYQEGLQIIQLTASNANNERTGSFCTEAVRMLEYTNFMYARNGKRMLGMLSIHYRYMMESNSAMFYQANL